ncbi:hypothetical protein Tco_0205776 [Tanacetum coccineum]
MVVAGRRWGGRTWEEGERDLGSVLPAVQGTILRVLITMFATQVDVDTMRSAVCAARDCFKCGLGWSSSAGRQEEYWLLVRLVIDDKEANASGRSLPLLR